MTTSIRRPARSAIGRLSRGLSLVELLVVIAVIALLMALLQPVLSLARAKGREVTCLNNLKQLQICAKLYSADNDDYLLPNRSVYSYNGTGFQKAAGYSRDMTWCTGLAPFDTNTVNVEHGLLFQYNRSTAIYRCPSDRSFVRSPDPNGGLLPIRRTRSYNLSQSINGVPYPFGRTAPTPPSFAKESEINDPIPARLIFFVGVHEDGIYDSHFGIPPRGWPFEDEDRPHWWDLPAGRHAQGGCFSFADGHVERWKWEAPKVFVKPGQSVRQDGDIEDYRRVQGAVKPQR